MKRFSRLFRAIASSPVRKLLFFAAALGCVATWQLSAMAQPKVILDPHSFGLEIPPGEVVRPINERVLTADTDGTPAVAKTHLKIGEHRVVMLPSGELVAREGTQAEPTERPFQPIAKDKLIERLQVGPFKNFKVKKSKNYVYLYSTSEEFAFGTGRILESMLPGVKKYLESQKIEVHDPEVPLVVIMFRSEDDFQLYRRMPEGVIAYYHTLSNQVVVYEESDRLGGRRDLAIQQAITTIAHEGTHQILHNNGVQQRLSVWPMWISEGMAEFLAPTSVGKKLQWKGAAQVNDLRMFELEQYIKSRAGAEANGDTIKHTVLAGQLTSTGYASAWSLTHYLATKRKADFAKYLAEVASIGPLEGSIQIVQPGIVPKNAVAFEKHFGNDYVDLEKKLIAHLQKLPYNDPFADREHFVATLTYNEGKKAKREANVFHTPNLATKWAQDLEAKYATAAEKESQIVRFPNRAAAETYARSWLKGN